MLSSRINQRIEKMVEQVRLDEERRLEESDSKIITPPSYTTNNLPLVASLLTPLFTSLIKGS